MSSAIKEVEVTRVESCCGRTHRRFLVASDQNSVVSLAHSQKGIFFLFPGGEREGYRVKGGVLGLGGGRHACLKYKQRIHRKSN